MTKIKHFLRRFLFCIVFLFYSMPLQAAVRVQETEDKIVIVIDPGHGGENLGTIENGFLEKEMTLKTARAMYEELCLYDNVEVYMTRTEDVDLTLKARAEFAASVNADFLFSLHYNASVNHNLFGSEIWISATPPYNAYGYQFGYAYLQEMQDMGLHLRGIKTRLNDEKTDYYGIIREATALSVPTAIIEHCHVDELRDSVFCDTDEKLVAFGKADAQAVAKYFGLKSTTLGVDYSAESNLPDANKNRTVKSTLMDETPPDICMIEVVKTENINDNVNVTLSVSAADYDSPLIFYDFSEDGGLTYSPLQPWPESNALDGSYKDTFELDMVISPGKKADIILRAYNLFDGYTESNTVTQIIPTTSVGEEAAVNAGNSVTEEANTVVKEEKNTPGTTTFMPAINEHTNDGEDEVSFLSFLKLCLVIVIILFIIVLVSQAMVYQKRKRRRRQRRNEDGNNRNQPR